MNVLPDTSIWVEYLRAGTRGESRALDGLLERGEVLMCGPVLAEILAGADPGSRHDLWLALGALPWADLDREGWRQVGEVAGELRRRGEILPLTDVEIAVAAVRADAAVWTRDRDFDRLPPVLGDLRRHDPEGPRPA